MKRLINGESFAQTICGKLFIFILRKGNNKIINKSSIVFHIKEIFKFRKHQARYFFPIATRLENFALYSSEQKGVTNGNIILIHPCVS